MDDARAAGERFGELVGILARLRGPGGCPWDREQDASSISDYFLEEVYEAVEAIRRDDAEAAAEELGDVLMEVVFLARLYEERGLFSAADAVAGINAKMIRRHPHVFGQGGAPSARGVLDEWVRRKKSEKRRSSHFEGIADAAPALLAAFQIGQRASHVGFDWPSAREALKKVREETDEIEEALSAGPREGVFEEIGDALFALAQVGRLAGANPETALRSANAKFRDRFAEMETRLRGSGKEPGTAGLDEMDRLWDEIKRERSGGGGGEA